MVEAFLRMQIDDSDEERVGSTLVMAASKLQMEQGKCSIEGNVELHSRWSRQPLVCRFWQQLRDGNT